MELKDLRGLVVTIMLIGLVLGVCFLILREFTDNMSDTSGTTINETIAFSRIMAGTYVGHNSSNMDCYKDFSVTNMYNETGNTVLIESANYTGVENTGRIYNATVLPTLMISDWLLGSVVVSYTFSYSNSTGCAGMEETINATEKIQEWLGILVILFIVSVLLFIVYKFAFGGVGGVPSGEKMKFGKSKGFGGFGRGGGDSGESAEI